ncbi:ArsR/SmtB family transcription factor [Anaerosacchariphilus polymeriproducens]|uniref:ArsR family transcriptional regulator n=1 Tax=Anaerosacchariphilus polymeriproducens TaxID=1812858 RepID=A0A371AX12_9FIRM|nr:metalloregulator ArsR/SmtB family transcription factor [Anaerosacchariphilus polymeriproducens]RDU24124.1 ArsR family transcriptional regulator [Anaerosacchariphilus polymeriproducens]
MKLKYENEAAVFKALSDPNRLLILEILQSGEKCACKLLEDLEISQSTLSHHMKILCEAGFVESNRQGKWMHYSINKEGYENAKKILQELESCMLTK